MNTEIKRATHALNNGGVVVVRTDTIYGIIALASNEAGVEKVYRVKKRDVRKQCIILIDEASRVPAHEGIIQQYSGFNQQPTSVIVPASSEEAWVLRGGNTIAYRLVRDAFLKELIQHAGPVIAPSANPEGFQPAADIGEARAYFGDQVDVYIDGGKVNDGAKASRIVQIHTDGSIEIIRD